MLRPCGYICTIGMLRSEEALKRLQSISKKSSKNWKKWRMFCDWLQYLGLVYGSCCPVSHTTRIKWSRCGTDVKKTLSTRTHICPSYHLILDRDCNASLDILGKGTQFAGMVLNTAGHAEINAWGDLHATLLLRDSRGWRIFEPRISQFLTGRVSKAKTEERNSLD